MNFPFYIARRYLFSKKSHHAINVISMISVCGVVVATLALVCALSVLNGFVSLVSSMFSSFDPELKIEARYGKVFDPQTRDFKTVEKLPELQVFSEVLQDNALVRYRDRQTVAMVKGVDDHFARLTQIDSLFLDCMEEGFILQDEVVNYAYPGVGLASTLGVRAHFVDPLEIFVPKRDEKVNLTNPATSFNQEYAYVGGVYTTNQQVYDENFLLLPLSLVRELVQYDQEVSSIEIGLRQGKAVHSIPKEIQKILGYHYSVKDRYQQQEASFKMMQAEKWMIFLILCFILMLALFNVIGSLSMLMIEKKADIQTLRNMGADDKLISRIFLFEGWMISAFGALLGIAIGLIICLLQQELGLLKLGQTAGSFVVDAYPVKVKFTDILIVFVTVTGIGFVAAWYPVHFLSKRWLKN